MRKVHATETNMIDETVARSDRLPDVVTRPTLRVLLLAYSISPFRGSEFSVGWNHVTYMSQFCDLTVLYGLAGPHMGDLEDVENYLRQNGEIPNVRFVAIRPPFIARLLNSPNRNGFMVYSFYMAYKVWHRAAAQKAQSLLANEPFDLVHYLCPIGYREPGFLWQFDRPYVWGPIGGMVPTRQLKGAPRSSASIWKTRLKNLTNAIQLRLSRRVAKALGRADVLVAATNENAEMIKTRFARDAKVVPENAIPDDWMPSEGADGQVAAGSHIRLVWVGSLDARKSPDLLIDALKRVPTEGWHLDIVGEGPLRDSLKCMISDAGLTEKVTLNGQISRSEVHNLMSRADLHIITSMNEANTTVVWEAMGSGVPTLSLEHSGMRDTLCDACGVLIPMSDYQKTCNAIASEIDRLICDPEELARKKAGALACAEAHLWSQRARTWLHIYDEAIVSHARNKPGAQS